MTIRKSRRLWRHEEKDNGQVSCSLPVLTYFLFFYLFIDDETTDQSSWTSQTILERFPIVCFDRVSKVHMFVDLKSSAIPGRISSAVHNTVKKFRKASSFLKFAEGGVGLCKQLILSSTSWFFASRRVSLVSSGLSGRVILEFYSLKEVPFSSYVP